MGRLPVLPARIQKELPGEPLARMQKERIWDTNDIIIAKPDGFPVFPEQLQLVFEMEVTDKRIRPIQNGTAAGRFESNYDNGQ